MNGSAIDQPEPGWVPLEIPDVARLTTHRGRRFELDVPASPTSVRRLDPRGWPDGETGPEQYWPSA